MAEPKVRKALEVNLALDNRLQAYEKQSGEKFSDTARAALTLYLDRYEQQAHGECEPRRA